MSTATLAEAVVHRGPPRLPGQRFFFEPFTMGPTWLRGPDGSYLLPELSLGWQVLDWVKRNLINPDGTPFAPTNEQARFLLWWYAVDEHGRFVYRNGILQRLKGWGKDPLVAVISAVELVGPCRFVGWSMKRRFSATGELIADVGDPWGGEEPRAWIQIAAVSKTQTQNTMKIFPGLFSEKCRREHGIDTTGMSAVYAHGKRRSIQAVTSSPRSLEGARPTFVVKNETHHWIDANDGHEMAGVIQRNAAKSAGGTARVLSITNAYEPSENSVAQRERETYEDELNGTSISTRTLYDTLEAPPDARLVFDGDWLFELASESIPDDDIERDLAHERLVLEYLTDIVCLVRGDSVWLDPEALVIAVLDGNIDPSQSRRFWFNQIVAAEDAWLDPAAIDASIDPMAAEALARFPGEFDATWLVDPDEPVVLFFDGSKSDDSTGIVASCVDRDYSFVVGVWEKPPAAREGKRSGVKWLAPRGEVRERGLEAIRRLNVQAFWADPSHAKDDEDESRYWDGVLDTWHKAIKDTIDSKWWAVRSGDRAHSVMWDMTSPERHAMFVGAAMRTVDEFEAKNDIEEFAPTLTIDGHPILVKHMRNARKNPNTRWGVSLMKENRESARKIDLAVCLVGARMLRRIVLNLTMQEDAPASGDFWN